MMVDPTDQDAKTNEAAFTPVMHSKCPQSIQRRLVEAWDAESKVRHFDYNGTKTPMVARFFQRYRMSQLPSGIWFGKIIADEC